MALRRPTLAYYDADAVLDGASAFAVEGLVIQQGYASPPPPVKPAAARPASANPVLRPKV